MEVCMPEGHKNAVILTKVTPFSDKDLQFEYSYEDTKESKQLNIRRASCKSMLTVFYITFELTYSYMKASIHS